MSIQRRPHVLPQPCLHWFTTPGDTGKQDYSISSTFGPELVTMAKPSVGLNLLKIKAESLVFSPDRSNAEEELLFDSEASLFEQSCILWQSTVFFLQVCLWLLEHWHRLSNAPSLS